MTQTKKRSGNDLDTAPVSWRTCWPGRIDRSSTATALPYPRRQDSCDGAGTGRLACSASMLVSTTVDGKDGQARTEAETFADHPGLLTSPMVGVVHLVRAGGAAVRQDGRSSGRGRHGAADRGDEGIQPDQSASGRLHRAAVRLERHARRVRRAAAAHRLTRSCSTRS